MILRSRTIVTERGIIDGWLVFDNGRITDILHKEEYQGKPDLDYTDNIVIPGLVDTHNHGMMGWGPHDGKSNYEDILHLLKALASVGVTSYFPTMTDGNYGIPGIVKAAEGDPDGAAVMGIHSEGPYLNRVGEKGVDTGHPEPDLKFIEKMYEDSQGWLKLVALAPELKGTDEIIHFLTSHNVRVAFAHSNCNYEEALASYRKGITVITHTGNVMSGLHHRNMGGLGAALLDDHVFNEVICDGLHIHNEMLEIYFRVKHDAYHKFMMISDNVPLAGFPEGRYTGVFPGSVCNITKEGFCLTDTGRLAGSAKPLIYGVRNLVKNMHIPLETVCRMASENAAEVYGFADRKGSLRVGKDADFAVIDDDFNVQYTWRCGRNVYDFKKDTDLINHQVYEKLRLK